MLATCGRLVIDVDVFDIIFSPTEGRKLGHKGKICGFGVDLYSNRRKLRMEYEYLYSSS